MKKHVLLVDDDKSELNLFIETLDTTKIEYKCTWSQTGAQALSQLQYLQPDFIFVKAQLPDMGAIDFLSRISRLPHASQAKVIIFMDHQDADFRMKTLALGAMTTIGYAANTPEFKQELQNLVAKDSALPDSALPA